MSTEMPKFEAVTDYLSWDHDRLDALLGDTSRLVDENQLDRAAPIYAEFHAGLLRHIRLEEEVLFPVFDERAGMEGPTLVMRQEHVFIKKALEMMKDGLAARDAKQFKTGHEALFRVLPDHNVKEEHILYPTTDRVLPPQERSELTRRLMAF